MKYLVITFEQKHIEFIDYIFTQNIEILHGNPISKDEWNHAFFVDPDSFEKNFIITADDCPAAWLKINGLHSKEICISMLVVADDYKRRGIGSFAIQFAEDYALQNLKTSVIIHTTKDNTAATNCYLKQKYIIEKEIRYAVGDGIIRDGYQFRKLLEVNDVKNVD